MKRGVLIIFLTLLFGNFISAQTYKYVGADKCKACHNKAASGEQYNKWMKEPHSQALKTLSGQKALDYAKKNSIADPAKEAKCLKCHSTYDIADPKLRGTILATEGVSCESCHGPGSAYKAIPVMRSHDLFLQNGGVVPNKELCLKCHGSKENPFFKELNYEAGLAKIAHPNPEKGKHN